MEIFLRIGLKLSTLENIYAIHLSAKKSSAPVGKTDELVVAHVEVLELGVKPQSGVNSSNVVLLQLESLDAGIECDRENFQLTVGAGNCKQ